ncbi:two-component regulator propeller domain-containing protein [Spirosoma spitsbergense]|uniref:two-component regulator propeller domain-containing protein n=1 Tax=Spirosoma spitsbergense TaxID=431554 RepID=UPI00035E8667|nr:two-component regulator propeller domain-containing protein [Spirosoma spitsbergense]
MMLCFSTLAQTQPGAAQPYAASVKHYGPEQGLSHREVNAIFQDRQGFMWFGTKLGLSRFDGQKFTTYTKERNGLGFDDIQSIAQDADGILWLMGPYGQSHITLFNPLTNKAISFNDKFGKQRSSTLFDFPQRLLSSASGTVFFTNNQPARLLSYHPASGLRSVSLPQFKQLVVFRATARNTVWAVADDKHLLELTLDGRIVHQFDHSLGSISICFGQQNAGIEFFYFIPYPGKESSDVFYSVDELGQRRAWPPSLLNSLNRPLYPICYAFDRTGLVWDGMSLRDSTSRAVLTIAPQIPGVPVTNRSFFRDRNGLFWLGTSFGVYQVKLAKNNFHRLFYQETDKGANMAPIRGITVAGNQVFANLENTGLYTTNWLGGPPKKLPLLATNPANARAYGLARDEQGTLYASINDQLVHYAPPTGARSSVSLPYGYILWTLHPFGPDQWLLGGQTGLLLFDTKREQPHPFTQYNQFTELAQAHILHIAPDRQGLFWLCASTGLYTVDPKKGVTARYWSGGEGRLYLPAESYQHFYQDSRGIYWLATANAGLIRWDRRQNQHRQFRRSEGLSNDNIYAVYADKRGHLWMSSDYGIMQFDPARFTTRSYFVEDGITNNEFNRIAHYQDKAGRIYFGGLNGITAFDPRDFQTQKPAAGLPLRITSFRQYDNATDTFMDKTDEVVRTNTITIPPGDRSSVLDFALLNYANAEKNVYAYQLTDIDTEWNYQTESSLRLSNLPYGDHRLLIKAQAADGQWSGNTLAINLLVVRPVYMRPWFLIGMALLAGAGIWAWLRWRIWQHRNEQIRLQREIQLATARIEADKEIIEQQARDLLRLNEVRSRFFANISHEFRTPLTVILGMAAQLENYKPTAPQPVVRKAAGLIERSGINLLRLINQILDLSKLEAGEMQLRPVQADLVGFVRYVGESFQSLAQARGVQLHFLLAEAPCEADFDRDKLQDILSNLLTNALKFTPEGGHIYYQLRLLDTWQPLSAQGYYEELTPTVYVDGPRLDGPRLDGPRLDSPWIQFSVRDTGPGISPASFPKVFDRFYQEDTQSASSVSGTGIGLSLVRELVLLMHGGLAVRNWSGRATNGLEGSVQGAEFVVSIPLTHEAQPIQAGPAGEPVPAAILVSPDPMPLSESEPASSGNGPVLLLVEDNDDVADYVQTCLAADYRVIRAENGQAGIDLALANIPDLILSDVMMPLKDGFELCDTLKNDERTSHIPIVLLTARAAVSDRMAGLRRGADAYLVKPFLREELLLVLGNLLQTRRQLQTYYSQLALGGIPPGHARQGIRLGGTQPDALPTEATPAAVVDALEDTFLTKLRTTVEGQLDNPELSVDTICLQLGMGRTTLHNKMTALTDMSISRYVRTLRLRKAQALLTVSALNVSEVAYAVGFDNPKYFSRLFSEEFGISPGNYRQSARG